MAETDWGHPPAKDYRVLPEPIVDNISERRRRFSWPDSHLEVLTDRVRVQSDGIHCWITISLSTYGDIYGPVRINLLSDTQRDALRRSLKDHSGFDWQQVIQYVAKATIAALDPASDLIDMAKYRPRFTSPWLVEPFIRRNLPSILYADGGEGKTTIGLTLGLSLASGKALFPGLTIPEPLPVHFLDFEADADDTVDTVHNLAEGAGIPFPAERFFYRRLSGALVDHLDNIQSDFSTHKIALVIIDSLVASGGGDALDSETARMYFAAVRSLGCASLGITHVTKNEKGDQEHFKKPFGSAFWWNLTRVAWELRRSQEEGESTALLALYNRKINKGAPKHRPIGLAVDYSDGIRYKSADVQDDPHLAKGTTVADQLWGLMGGRLWSLQELYEELSDISEGSIRGTLARNEGKRFGKIPPEMKWGRLAEAYLSHTASTSLRVTDRNVTRNSGGTGTTVTPPLKGGGVTPAVPVTPPEKNQTINALSITSLKAWSTSPCCGSYIQPIKDRPGFGRCEGCPKKYALIAETALDTSRAAKTPQAQT